MVLWTDTLANFLTDTLWQGYYLEVLMAPSVIMRSWTGLTTHNVTERNIRVEVGLLAAGQHLSLEWDDKPTGPDAHYVQVMCRPEGDFQVEYRAGSAAEHYQTFTTSRDDVVAALLGWCQGGSAWRAKFEWTCIGDMFTDPGRRVPISE